MFADTTQRDIRSELGTTPIFAYDSTSLYDVCTTKIQPFLKFAKRFQKKSRISHAKCVVQYSRFECSVRSIRHHGNFTL